MSKTTKRLLWITPLLLLLLWIIVLPDTPNADGPWKVPFSKLAEVSIEGDTINIHAFRDFRYMPDQQVAEARFLDKQFQLSELNAVWLGLSYFGARPLAHAFLSFQFGAGETADYLVISIEARQQQTQAGYSPVKGLFRQYSTQIILGSEQDIIGLRSHIRQEPVYLFPLRTNNVASRALLLGFLRQAQLLEETPRFYNTITDNCLTGLLYTSNEFRDITPWLDWRILLPGYVDEMAYDYDLFDAEGSYEQLRNNARARIDGYSIDDPLFSMKLRSPREQPAVAE